MTRHCSRWISKNCPDRRSTIYLEKGDRRRSPRTEAKCGTVERNYQPCTSKLIANKLFKACCDLYVPEECHFMCTYEIDQSKTRSMLLQLVKQKKCSMRYLSSILYCASQNRDNRRCCEDLDLNATQLQIVRRLIKENDFIYNYMIKIIILNIFKVGSRCLRMCDPSGTAIERLTKEDVTCLYNWNVIMYCHHAGIREM
ncbi:DB module [Necator americanus]|uniref:DB module n=1 Tax=Necator americanus TaxID=51031 RepID=W2TV33_NECAM|nr:DB module [Necator americanus]ETN85960.1 DB module [Necator americanus]